MNIPGTKDEFIVIGDSDGLIALLHEEDKNYTLAKATVEQLLYREAQVVFPLTAIVETVTTFQRKLNEPALAASVMAKLSGGGLSVDPVDKNVLKDAAQLFKLAGSKQNTLFDALIAATAQKRGTQIIFSFDRWYKKLGFTLASDYVLGHVKAA